MRSRRAFQMTMISIITSITSALNECLCSAQFSPVCATNGEVFSNECMLRCYNYENHANLGVNKVGHCRDMIEGTSASTSPPEDAVGGAADVCLFTKDYNERYTVDTINAGQRELSAKKGNAKKSRNYFHLLAALCTIECAVLFLARMFVMKLS